MREAICKLAGRRQRGQHPGLLLQRYLDGQAVGKEGDPNKKRQLLDDARAVAAHADVRQLYNAAYRRWEESLPELTAAGDFRVAGRLIVGLGSENVLETGLRLHHTYGLPVIPGSALKGLAAHYCHECWGRSSDAPASEKILRFRRATDGDSDPTGEFHRVLFGTTDDGGCLTFHDAWLTSATTDPLARDVMTPHHPDWLDGRAPPTDFDSPIPVPFLSVVGTFRVAVSWQGPLTEQAPCWTGLALDLLAEALLEWGVGGKTSSGYGQLTDAGNRRTPFSAALLGLPAKDSVVSATLLERPRHNRPWRARITLRNGKDLCGPVEPAERTPAAAPDQVVSLVVTHVDAKSIRFAWPS